MATTLYLVVVGSGTKETTRRYMYDTSTPVEEFESETKTASIWQVTADSEEHAQFLANYQMGRLNSGLFGCAIEETLKEARKNFFYAKTMIGGRD